jgi:hypothetical protein
LKRRRVFATVPEYIGKEADGWEEDSHFGADEDSSIAYGVGPSDRAGMMETIARAIALRRSGTGGWRNTRLADRLVTRVGAGNATISDEETLTLYRAAEDLLAHDRAKNDRDAEALEWAKAHTRS